MSTCFKMQNKEHVSEGLGKARFKFTGHQKIYISKNQDFIRFNADEFEVIVAENQLISGIDGIKYMAIRDPLTPWRPFAPEAFP